MKKLIIGFILGGIIFGSGVYAAATYLAKDITYKDNKNVEQAIDELKQTSDTTITNLQSSNASKDQTIQQKNQEIASLNNQINELSNISNDFTVSCGNGNNVGVYGCFYNLPSNHTYKKITIKNIRFENSSAYDNASNSSAVVGTTVNWAPTINSEYNIENKKFDFSYWSNTNSNYAHTYIDFTIE